MVTGRKAIQGVLIRRRLSGCQDRDVRHKNSPTGSPHAFNAPHTTVEKHLVLFAMQRERTAPLLDDELSAWALHNYDDELWEPPEPRLRAQTASLTNEVYGQDQRQSLKSGCRPRVRPSPKRLQPSTPLFTATELEQARLSLELSPVVVAFQVDPSSGDGPPKFAVVPRKLRKATGITDSLQYEADAPDPNRPDSVSPPRVLHSRSTGELQSADWNVSSSSAIRAVRQARSRTRCSSDERRSTRATMDGLVTPMRKPDGILHLQPRGGGLCRNDRTVRLPHVQPTEVRQSDSLSVRRSNGKMLALLLADMAATDTNKRKV